MWGSIISAGASLIGGAMGSSASNNAADAQTAASQAAIAEQRRQYNQTRSDNAPFLNTGTAANQRLAHLLGIGPKTSNAAPTAAAIQQLYNSYIGRDAGAQELAYMLQKPDMYSVQQELNNSPGPKSGGDIGAGAGNGRAIYSDSSSALDNPADYGSLTRNFTTADMVADPVYSSGYDFAQKNAADSINSRALASGSYDSGATLKALQAQGVNVANQYGNDAYNRYNTNNTNTYNRLAGVSGAGQVAANTVASAGANMANNVSSLQTGIGNSTAASIVGGSNAWGNAFSGVGNSVNNYNSNQTLQALLKNQNSGQYSGYQYPGQYSTSNVQYG